MAKAAVAAVTNGRILGHDAVGTVESVGSGGSILGNTIDGTGAE